MSRIYCLFFFCSAVQSVLALMCGADYQTVCSKSFKILAKLRGRNLWVQNLCVPCHLWQI